MSDKFEDLYPASPRYREMQPLRIPSGWLVGLNQLQVSLESAPRGLGGLAFFHAINEWRRFSIDVEFLPEFDPEGSFHLIVTYQPWPRTERGRRRQGAPFALGADAREVHRFETRSYPDLIAELEHWIARCTVWQVEGN